MSHILDALKKAEQQRTANRPPDIHTVASQPITHAPGKSPLLLIVVALLLINLALGGAWLLLNHDSQPLAPSAPPTPPTTQSPPPATELQQAATPSSPAVDTAAVPAVAPRSADSLQIDRRRPPPLLDRLPALIRETLPPIDVTAHAYAGKNSPISFVIINGERLQNGSTTASGLQVIAIGATELLLEYRTRQFRIPIHSE